MAEPESEFKISIDQVTDYEFRVNFEKEPIPDLLVDEGPPLGKDAGPSPSRLPKARWSWGLPLARRPTSPQSRSQVR